MTITKVACGQDFTMALTDKGRIVGWGNNRNGQIGHPASDIIQRPRCVYVNPFFPRPAKTVHFVILLFLTPDNITH